MLAAACFVFLLMRTVIFTVPKAVAASWVATRFSLPMGMLFVQFHLYHVYADLLFLRFLQHEPFRAAWPTRPDLRHGQLAHQTGRTRYVVLPIQRPANSCSIPPNCSSPGRP